MLALTLPPASTVADEMTRFFRWYEHSKPPHRSLDTLLPGPIRAAITHLWFVTIHPFDDGNGRIARALADHALVITQDTIAWTVQKAEFLQQHQDAMNARQRAVVLDLFSHGAGGDPRSVNRNKYVKRAQCSPSTALRDLQDLVGKSVLVQLPGEGRNTRYGLNIRL